MRIQKRRQVRLKASSRVINGRREGSLCVAAILTRVSALHVRHPSEVLRADLPGMLHRPGPERRAETRQGILRRMQAKLAISCLEAAVESQRET